MKFVNKLLTIGLSTLSISTVFAGNLVGPSSKDGYSVAPDNFKMFAGRLVTVDNKAPACEYNSELAAAVQTAHQTQSGMANPNCEGLSKDQLMSLTFKAIEFPANYQQNLRDRVESAYKDRNELAMNLTSSDQLELEPNEAINEMLGYAYIFAISNNSLSKKKCYADRFI